MGIAVAALEKGCEIVYLEQQSLLFFLFFIHS